MTWIAIHPLLKSDDFVGAIIFFVIWGVLALLSQIGKWQERKRKQQQTSVPPTPPLPTGLQPPQQRRAQQQQQRNRPRPVQPPRTPALPPNRPVQSSRQPVQMPVARAPVYTPPPHQPPIIGPTEKMPGEIGAASEKNPTRALAVDVREIREAMRPRSLRKQVVLMEVLQPPLALRDQQR